MKVFEEIFECQLMGLVHKACSYERKSGLLVSHGVTKPLFSLFVQHNERAS